jgi:hypothetical protein
VHLHLTDPEVAESFELDTEVEFPFLARPATEKISKKKSKK